MEKRFCLNVTLDDNKYSSPMPIIGLYIAGGTLVCLLFMICDIFHGLYRKKLWIPCRFSSINSVTLTLLAIASKLPVDLTTPMPSAHEQLSKLSGTVLICIFMSLFSHSLLTQSDSERISNLICLSIFVVTVVVNVCMQMVTGLIFLFIKEHIIIMSCMLLLLAVMWFTFEIRFPYNNGSYPSRIGNELKKIDPLNSESKSMIYRLKSVFVSNYEYNPELCSLEDGKHHGMYMISVLCALILSQAAVRSLVLKEADFRCGVSDYKWSIWMVVVTQILTVLVGGIAIVFRWVFSIKIVSEKMTKETVICFGPPSWVLSTLKKLSNVSLLKISRRGFVFIFQIIARNTNTVLRILTVVLIALSLPFTGMLYALSFCMMEITKFCFGKQRNGDDMIYKDKDEWIQRKCEEDIKKWMEKGKMDSPTHLIQLLSKTPPSQDSPISKFSTTSNESNVSCLLMAIFIRVAIIALPDRLVASLIHTFDETFEIIYFIDKEMNGNKRSCSLAKELWKNRENVCHWFHKRFLDPSIKKFYSQVLKKSMDGELQSQPQLELELIHALGVIEEVKATKDIFSCYFFEDEVVVGDEIDIVYKFIFGQDFRRTYTSIDELYGHIVQLFVDMLHLFLSQLPLAIFKHLIESPTYYSEERTGLVLKFICKLESLNDIIHWIFPDGAGITTLTIPQVPPIDTQVHHSLSFGSDVTNLITTTQVSAIDTQRIELVESDADANVACQAIEDYEIQEFV